MYYVLLVIFLIVAMILVSLIILQKGKNANMNSSLNTGVSSTIFGSKGANNFLIKMTILLAAIFFILSLILGNLGSYKK